MASMEGTQPLPGCDAIGHSYDAFGYFANPRSVMKELFEFGPQQEVVVGQKKWLLSRDIRMQEIRDALLSTVSVRTKDAYSTELAASVKLSGSYGAFSASVESDFWQKQSGETDSTYTSVRSNITKWKLTLKDGPDALRTKLQPAFKQALESMDVVQLFDTYGTHYLNEILVGGRADYVATTKTSAFSSDISIAAVAEASYGATASGQASTQYKNHVDTFRSNSTTRFYSLGGNAVPNITDPATYSAWLQSVDTNPIFCGFTYDNSIRPIAELAQSTQRRQLLMEATRTYIPQRITRNALVALEVIVSSSSVESPPYGFTRIDYDLNRNAKGKYVFLCYKQAKISVAGSPADPDPITDVYISMGDGKDTYVPPGYTKIDKDLNAGSGGKYIFLCYTKDKAKAKDGLPIRGLRVIAGDDGEIAPPYGFTKIWLDLNQGAGGDFIFLCYSRNLD